jgi:phage head maturation protease
MIRGQGTIAVRDQLPGEPPDPEGDGRTVEGVAVPYGVPVTGPTREYGDATEVFERGAFADYVAGGGRVALLDTHDGVVVGMADLTDTDAGLAYRGRLFTSQAARDYAERVAGGMRSVSIEFTPGKVRRGKGQVSHIGGAIAHGIAGTYRPAYGGATVALREGTGMETTNTENAAPGASETPVEPFDEARVTTIARTVARGELERAERARAENGARDGGPASPFGGVRTLGELMVRGVTAAKGDPILNLGAAIARRAIANQVIADSPGVHSGGVEGTIRGIVNPSRPVVNAFGTDDPGGSGLTAYWPYVTVDIETLVGVQSAEKAEITSVKVPILRGSAVLATYAGGSDVSWQNKLRSDPSYMEGYTRIMLAAWAAVTDKAFATAILAAAGTTLPTVAVGATDQEIRAAIFAASVLVEKATGSPASFALAGSNAFTYFGGKLPMAPIVGGSGTSLASTLNVSISGIQLIHAPHITTDNIIVSNRQAAAWLEEGPYQAVAEDVLHLGSDYAIWSMGTAAVYAPLGIVKILKTPVADAEAASSSSRK